jgi:hypothetical protein
MRPPPRFCHRYLGASLLRNSTESDAMTLTVDRRELSTIIAALLLLQEQMPFLPEDVAEMLTAHGQPVTEDEIGDLISRLQDTEPADRFERAVTANLVSAVR